MNSLVKGILITEGLTALLFAGFFVDGVRRMTTQHEGNAEYVLRRELGSSELRTALYGFGGLYVASSIVAGGAQLYSTFDRKKKLNLGRTV